MSKEEKTVMFAMPNLLTGHLACLGGTMSGRSWELTAGTFTIGRLDDHDMCLSSEPGVSKTHAKIMGQGDHYIIVDAESRNGTLINGSPVQKTELYDGDEIRICGCLLRFTQVGGRLRPRVPTSPVDATAAYSQPPMPMAAPPAIPTGPQIMAPTAPSFSPAPAFSPAPTPAPSQLPFAPVVPAAPMALMVAGPSTGRVLATWYAAGLAASLLLGGAASAALVATAPDAPTDGPVAVAVATAPADAVPPAPGTPDAAPVDPAAVAPVDVAVADAAAVPVAAVPPVEPAPPPAVVPPPPEPPAPPPAVAVEPAAVEPAAVAPEPERRRSSPAPAGSAAGPFPAGVEAGGSEVLKSRSGGRVKTALADGAAVSKGTVIVTFETSADAGELATLQDRIASLEGVEGEEAKRDLKAAKQKLAALEGGQNAAPIVATMDGVLQGFSAQPGTIVKAGESLGRVVDTSVTPRVKVTVLRATRPKNGQKVMMSLKTGGSISGTVVAVSGRTVVIDPGSEPAENIESVQF